MTDEIELLRDIASNIGERWSDYLVIVRSKGDFMWKHSDPTWGLGAAERYSASIKDKELIDQISALED